MNVLKENTVSEYFLQRSLTGFPKLCKKKNKKKKKQNNAKTYTNTSDRAQNNVIRISI